MTGSSPWSRRSAELTAPVGTFAVRVAKDGTDVVVARGRVAVNGLNEAVRAGQQLAANADKQTAAPRISHLLGWTRDLMAAAESPLVPASQYAGGALVAIDPNGQEAKLTLRKYHIDVHIEDGFARTTIDQTYFNHDRRAAGRHVLLPAAAGRLAVAAGDVRRWQADGRRHGRARLRPAGLRDDRLPASATRPCWNGWTAAPSRCASSRWKPGRRNASSSATRSGCRRCTARRSIASPPATAWQTVARLVVPCPHQGRRRPGLEQPLAPADGDARTAATWCSKRPAKNAQLDRDVVADPDAIRHAAGGVGAVSPHSSRTAQLPDAALPARLCRSAMCNPQSAIATGSSCSSPPATAIRCWRGRRSR